MQIGLGISLRRLNSLKEKLHHSGAHKKAPINRGGHCVGLLQQKIFVSNG
jgi:hypothetical protein